MDHKGVIISLAYGHNTLLCIDENQFTSKTGEPTRLVLPQTLSIFADYIVLGGSGGNTLSCESLWYSAVLT